MMSEEMVTEMSDGKEKELMKILQENAKPFVKKHDGYAVKCKENKKLTWKDHEGVENTVEVPEGSYVCVDSDSHYPKIVTAEDFEKKNKFLDNPKEKKNDNPVKEEKSKIGMDSMY
jgi:hypothetical protein